MPFFSSPYAVLVLLLLLALLALSDTDLLFPKKKKHIVDDKPKPVPVPEVDFEKAPTNMEQNSPEVERQPLFFQRLLRQRKFSFLTLLIFGGIIVYISFGDNFLKSNNQPGRCDPHSICNDLSDLKSKIDSIKNKTPDSPLKEANELIKEIKELKAELVKVRAMDEATSSSGSNTSWVSIVAMIIIGIAVVIILLWLIVPYDVEWKAVATLSSILTVSGLALFSIENLNGEFKFFERNIINGQKEDSTDVVRIRSGMKIDSLGAIKKFAVGKFNKGYNLDDLATIKSAIRNNGNISALFLIGEVDRRELNSNAREDYGSNIGLARARAEHIRSEIFTLCKDLGILILTMNRAAFHTGKIIGDEQLSLDRQVVIYAVTQQ
jgi:hypothetical protein